MESVFAACSYIVEEMYDSPRQMHTYMETEGGLFVPEQDGRLTVYSPTQHGFMDSASVIPYYRTAGGGHSHCIEPNRRLFRGKDELNVQPYGVLLALAANQPVKIHHSRWESVRAGLKRHPIEDLDENWN